MASRRRPYLQMEPARADLCSRVNHLNIQQPGGLALLPHNFDNAEGRDDLIHESALQTIRIPQLEP
jgi:hypothetical protein